MNSPKKNPTTGFVLLSMEKEGFFQYVNNLNSFIESVKPKEGRICMTIKGLTAVFFLLIGSFLYGLDSYEQGLEDFRAGRQNQAVLNFEKTLESDPKNDGACLYLGILYQKLGNAGKAESAYVKGKEIQGLHYNDIIFNLANLYFNLKRFDESKALYETLIQQPGKLRTDSLLNLANLSVNTGSYQKAIDLYMEYLLEDSETPQRPEIEKMVTLLKKTLDDELAKKQAEEERLKNEAEQAKAKAEAEKKRLEEEAQQQKLAEQKRLEEEAKQKALLNDILNNLSKSGDQTKNKTAPSEKVKEDFGESGLDD